VNEAFAGIKLTKVWSGASGGAVTVHLAGPQSYSENFQLDGDGAMVTLNSLVPGVYTVTETSIPAGSVFVGMSVTGAADTNGSPSVVSFDLVADAAVEVEVENAQLSDLKLTKNWIGSSLGPVTVLVTGPSSGCQTFSGAQLLTAGDCQQTFFQEDVVLDGDGAMETLTDLQPGLYTITEISWPQGAEFVFATASGATDQNSSPQIVEINLVLDAFVEVTVTNEAPPPPPPSPPPPPPPGRLLRVEKDWLGAEPGTSVSIAISGPSVNQTITLLDGESRTFSGIAAGSYTIIEVTDADLVGYSPDNDGDPTNGTTVTVPGSGNVTVVVENQALGSLRVEKDWLSAAYAVGQTGGTTTPGLLADSTLLVLAEALALAFAISTVLFVRHLDRRAAGVAAVKTARAGEDDDLHGISVNIAKRLESAAATNGILVSDVVKAAVAGKDFAFADQGEVSLKGFEEPVRTWSVEWTE